MTLSPPLFASQSLPDLNHLTLPAHLILRASAAQHLLARNSLGEIVTFSAQSGDSGVERRWRDGSLELDLPSQVRGSCCTRG